MRSFRLVSSLRALAPQLVRGAGLLTTGSLVLGTTSPTSCFFELPASVQSLLGLKPDYNAVAQSIADILEDNPSYDDGSYGPLFVRLAWHASGTFSAKDGSGGSNGGCMRFKPEAEWGANAGLGLARSLLEKIKAKHPGISYADLYTLSGVVAIQAMGGPVIPWRPGRVVSSGGNQSILFSMPCTFF